MTRLTDDALAAIRARADAATPGPWGVLIHDDCTEINAPGRDRVAVFPYRRNPRDEADAAFVCDARTDVPALLAHADTLAAKLAEVERERDEARRDFAAVRGFLDDNPNALGTKLRAAFAEQRRLAAEVERMRLVVEAACLVRDAHGNDLPGALAADRCLDRAVDAYRAAPQPPAVCDYLKSPTLQMPPGARSEAALLNAWARYPPPPTLLGLPIEALAGASTAAVNVCEHGDHPAPAGRRFCSDACMQCEGAPALHGDECAGICLARTP